ncbi:hypothetical protein WA158_000151 [Blastocystis sp. Blastoise]
MEGKSAVSRDCVIGSKLTPEEKYELITRNLQEVEGGEELLSILKKRDVKIYWGTAPTGKPHIGYFVPMTKIADFLSAGCEVTVLFANLHAYLDNMKSTWEQLKSRTAYYEEVIKGMLRSVGVPLDKLKFVRGTDYQLSEAYTLDVYKLSSLVSSHDAKKAGAEVVKQVENPALSGLLYPELQALDEQYLDVDIQFGGVDQRKIFMFANKYLPKIGYKRRIHLMNTMVPGLTGDKMSSSVENSKIDLLDTPKAVSNKIKGAFCEPGNTDTNGVMAFAIHVLFNLVKLPYTINRPEKYGGKIEYATKEALLEDYKNGILSPQDLKLSVTDYLNALLDPIRAKFACNAELQKILEDAYGEKKAVKKELPADLPPVCRLCFKVGKITKIWELEGSDKLYAEEIDCGEETPRTVMSGLRNIVPMSELENRRVIVVTNFKSRRTLNFESNGMVLCACNEDNSKIEPLTPPEGAALGEIVTFEGLPDIYPDDEVVPTRKTSPWGKSSPYLTINKEGEALYKEARFMTSAGPVTVPTLKEVKIC